MPLPAACGMQRGRGATGAAYCRPTESESSDVPQVTCLTVACEPEAQPNPFLPPPPSSPSALMALRPRVTSTRLVFTAVCVALSAPSLAQPLNVSAVRVSRSLPSTMNLCEVRLLTSEGSNCALGGVATASSTSETGGSRDWPPWRINNGRWAPTAGLDYDDMWHSAQDTPPWIMVTLPSPCAVASVEVWGRAFCCTERDIGDLVELLDASGGVVYSTTISAFFGTSPPTWINVLPSATGSSTPTLSATVSDTGSTTPTYSATKSATSTRTQSHTRSPSPSPPICRGLPAVALLRGTSGISPATSTASTGNPAMYTSGSCTSGYKTYFPGPRLVFALDLGATTPLGGTLTITTCGHTANNTVLYVGTGCPTWALPFGCLVGSDNAVPACSSNGFASTVAFLVTQSNYFIQLGGVNGGDVVSGLGWTYMLPPRSRSASTSIRSSYSRSHQISRTRSTSRSASRSRSRKAK